MAPSAPFRRRLTRRECVTLLAYAAGSLTLGACRPSPPPSETVLIAEIPLSGGIITDHYVILQPQLGQFHAFSSRCPHAGLALTTVTSTAVVCTHHDAQFDPATGQAIAGPTTTALTPATVHSDGTTLTVTLP